MPNWSKYAHVVHISAWNIQILSDPSRVASNTKFQLTRPSLSAQMYDAKAPLIIACPGGFGGSSGPNNMPSSQNGYLSRLSVKPEKYLNRSTKIHYMVINSRWAWKLPKSSPARYLGRYEAFLREITQNLNLRMEHLEASRVPCSRQGLHTC